MTIEALLGLGGNVGDRRANMDAAVDAIAALPETTLLARSQAYRSEPDGPVAQDWFVNLVVLIRTGLTPDLLAAACREIETSLGRDRAREIPWGPRTLDIDLLATGTLAEMRPTKGAFDDRPFVVAPAAEVAPQTRIGGKTLAERAASADRTGLAPLPWTVPPVS